MKQHVFTLVTTLFLSVKVFATEFKAFEQAEFDSVMQIGKPILIDVYADWCSTCRRQFKELDSMLKEPEFANLTAFKVNYDEQKEALKFFDTAHKSTLIMFDKGQEIRRSVAQTNTEYLRKFITLP